MSLTRQLISAGFEDVERAKRFLGDEILAGADEAALLAGLRAAADPDQALLLVLRLAERAPGILDRLHDVDAAIPVLRLLGASEALGDFLVRHPEQLRIFAQEEGPGDEAPDPGAFAGASDDDTRPEAPGLDPSSGPDVSDGDEESGTPTENSDTAVVAGAPEGWRQVPYRTLRQRMLRAVGADPDDELPVATHEGKDGYALLRVAYRAGLAQLALRDVGAEDPSAVMPAVAAELADLAGAAVDGALAIARLEAAERFAADAVAAVHLAVIGMGKCGAWELNYISDVDVIYVHEAEDLDDDRAAEIAATLAIGISRAINSPGPEPSLWEVDANLRPEGKDGALSRTLSSHVAYYDRWAKSWEFQALLKARCIAGDIELGRRYEEAVAPMIWNCSERDGFVESVQGMRKRVLENISPDERSRQLKLGPGGLRDVEFTVQLLQLVHGRVDETLRVRDTTSAITALSVGGYIGRADAADFDQAYRYLRVLEHRLQLVNMRRTHLMPVKEEALRVLFRASGGKAVSGRKPADELTRQWQNTKRSVRRLHESIFYRPLLASASNLSTDEVRLSPTAAQARLAALGYLDPKGAMRHIEALTTGVRRRAALQRQLLPVLLEWLAEGVDPDAGLLGFRRLSEALGESHWYLGMLRDSKAAAERLCHVLSGSRFITDLLEVSPESASWLGDDRELRPLSFDQLWQENKSKLKRHGNPESAMRLVRLNRRRELLRIALADSANLLSIDEIGWALSDVDRAAVLAALRVAESHEFETTRRMTDLLVVAMGRQGGREIGYGSDADVIYVHRPLEGADPQEAQQQALRVFAHVGKLLTQPLKPAVLAEPKLVVDAGLRPEGKNGPLARSLESFRGYYDRWALVWERQALLRARPMAGSDSLAAEFMTLVDGVRYGRGATPDEVREIRRVKARVEAERLPRGADSTRHVKLGRGGLSDVEWLVQLLQLEHAKDHPELRTTSTREALAALAELELLPPGDVELLDRAGLLAPQIRGASVACTGRASDVLPRSWRDMEAVARWCGYPAGNASELENDYRRVTRRARSVFERHFYGFEENGHY
ncbi:MAG: bifunctional [glutamine synthetase] adenylyltransferase/[glutamine synthetase]-adenylyl-L-tyrosine phosphorylase [Micrococcaceae bacterium]|nr:bifunctional [glutamine synthetase] adenylyltransferase/[glutamine synthetase]-adenylyl-L-tyrosine phosphorylase [Micrococcaceae bacterium]